jgi:hypothetical protein
MTEILYAFYALCGLLALIGMFAFIVPTNKKPENRNHKSDSLKVSYKNDRPTFGR